MKESEVDLAKLNVRDEVSSKRQSSFGVRSASPHSSDGMQNLEMPGVPGSSSQHGDNEGGVWLTGGAALIFHHDHLQMGRGPVGGCPVCRSGFRAVLAESRKVDGGTAGVDEVPGADKRGDGALPPAGGDGKAVASQLQEPEGAVPSVEDDWVQRIFGKGVFTT